MFGSDEFIGYDSTMHRGLDDIIKAISVTKAKCTVIDNIFFIRGCEGVRYPVLACAEGREGIRFRGPFVPSHSEI